MFGYLTLDASSNLFIAVFSATETMLDAPTGSAVHSCEGWESQLKDFILAPIDFVCDFIHERVVDVTGELQIAQPVARGKKLIKGKMLELFPLQMFKLFVGHLLLPAMKVPAIRCLCHAFQFLNNVGACIRSFRMLNDVSKDGNQRFPGGRYIDVSGCFIHIL